jgi:hypothetical protein
MNQQQQNGKRESTDINRQLKKVLNWKLDFYDLDWQDEYDSRMVQSSLASFR